jgi:dTDP-4-dehydrorhamnose 3,5-epimerase
MASTGQGARRRGQAISGDAQARARLRREMRPAEDAEVIAGVRRLALEANADSRGALTELCRHSWLEPGEVPVQWNVVRSDAGVLRGLHWHNVRFDYLVPVVGRIVVGLVDLRIGSPHERRATTVELRSEHEALVIPPGVGHGFFSPAPTLALYAITEFWDAADEFGVRWDDAAVAVPWPDEVDEPTLSDRDAALPSLDAAAPLPCWRGSASAGRADVEG